MWIAMRVKTPPQRKSLDFYLGLATPLAVVFTLIWSLSYLSTQLKSYVLVEPVSVPKDMSEAGLTDVAAQRALVTALQKVISDARQTMPGEINDEIQADEPALSIVVPGTEISLQSIVEGTKRMLHFHDVTIRSTILEQPSATVRTAFLPAVTTSGQANANKKYTVRVYVTDALSDVGDETTPPADPADALEEAALAIMKVHNKFIYASALATRERKKCYDDVDDKCSFELSIAAFKDVLKDDSYRRYHGWTWLALSKIDEDQGNYTAETTKALIAVRQDPGFFWAYYNWGVGLGEQGCDLEALEAFETARQYNPLVDFVNNAIAREALILASQTSGEARTGFLDKALSSLSVAILRNPAYMEALLNMARTLHLLEADRENALAKGQISALDRGLYGDASRHALDRVLLSDSAEVQRAFYFYRNWSEFPSAVLDLPANSVESMTAVLQSVHSSDATCTNAKLASSILETKGCLSPDDKRTMSRRQGISAELPQPLRQKAREPDCKSQSVARNIHDDDAVSMEW
jgi:tetratricopeptide (TPR) repeat protein